MGNKATNQAGKGSKSSEKDLLREAMRLEAQGRPRETLAIARDLVKRNPAWAHAHYAVGSALCALGMLDESDLALKKAIVRNDKVAGFFARHAEVLNRLGHHEQAVQAIEAALTLTPDDPRILVVQSMVLRLAGKAEEAYENLEKAIESGCDDPNLRSTHATLAGQTGRLDQGIADLEQLVQEAEQRVWVDKFMHSAFLMHLSRLYDQAGRYEDAFNAARAGAEMRQTGYDPDEIQAVCEDRIRVWSSEMIAKLPRSRVKSEKLVFILGMPRSGTSLIEQIIASHPRGFGSGELLETSMASRELGEPTTLQPNRMDVVEQLKQASLDRYARKIVKAMEKAAGKGIERITDKLPNNYEHVGMINLLFPDAKIIHCKRNPLDTCISCFLLDFVGDRNHGYTYNLAHLARQYRIYEQYMNHWKQVSPIEMLEVDYEDLVANPADGAKGIMEYIGLEWDDRCASSHETKRAVSTLSSDQVRKPMYTSSVGRWKNYEPWIGELVEGLGERD